MDETANQIEAHIDRTRERLGSNLRELESRVDAATDWREFIGLVGQVEPRQLSSVLGYMRILAAQAKLTP